MVRRRVRRTRVATSTRSRRKPGGLAKAATLLPLAIGLAANVSPSRVNRRPQAAATAIVGQACTLPFDAIKQSHSIDTSCPMAGTASSNAQALQNEAKNNFCAKGPPVNLNLRDFAQLQQAAETAGIPFGGDNSLPEDRDALHNIASLSNGRRIGEGTVVRVAAFVMNARNSNTSNGESVNCKHPGIENNDIHIVLGENPVAVGQKPTEAQECQSITAEMSPHFRPDTWTRANLLVNNQKLYRFTGQLFFDAAHKPCVGTTGPNPKRMAIWEVHPVYAVEVCSDGTSCTVDKDANWVPLDQFVGGEPPTTETRVLPLDRDWMLFRGSAQGRNSP